MSGEQTYAQILKTLTEEGTFNGEKVPTFINGYECLQWFIHRGFDLDNFPPFSTFLIQQKKPVGLVLPI